MLVLLSTDRSRGDVAPMVGLAVQPRVIAAAAEEWDAPVATGLMPSGGWR
jgi:hypothetical protein